MALDPNIILRASQGTTPNLISALTQGIEAGRQMRMQPLLDELKLELLQQKSQANQAALAQAETMDPLKQKLLELQIGVQQKALDTPTVPESLKEIRKEVRGQVRKSVTDLGKQSSVLTSNFKKLDNLTEEIKKGNRSAVAQGLVALVKLGDPGSIVNDSEMKNALNAQDFMGAVTSLLSGKGVDKNLIEAVTSKIDPLNPNKINTNELLNTARALISANVPSIQNAFSVERERAMTNLSKEGFGSIFTPKTEQAISELSSLIQPATQEEVPTETPKVEKPVQKYPEGTVIKNPSTGAQMIMRNGNWEAL